MFLASILTKLSSTDIVGIMTLLSGLIIGLVKAFNTRKVDKILTDAAQRNNILEGYGKIVKDLQAEIDRVRSQYSQDSMRWDDSRDHFDDRIEELENVIETLQRRLKVKGE